MKRFTSLAACCLFFAATHAAGPPDEPLDPEKAFRLSVAIATDAAGLNLRYAILDGYYMYRNRFKLEVVTPGQKKGLEEFLLQPTGTPWSIAPFGSRLLILTSPTWLGRKGIPK